MPSKPFSIHHVQFIPQLILFPMFNYCLKVRAFVPSIVEQAAVNLRANRPTIDRNAETEKVLSKRLEDAQHELQVETEQWNTATSKLRDEQQRRRAEMLERHLIEQEEYSQKWKDSGSLLPYSKPSPDLLKLRTMQKLMALAKRFDEAKQIKKQGEAMQMAEAKAGEQRAIGAIRAGYQSLRERQMREIACFDEHERRNIVYLEKERERLTETIVM